MKFHQSTAILLFSWFLFFSGTMPNSYKWEFWKEKEGVRVYTRMPTDSKIKELKMETVFTGSLASFVAVTQDMDSYERWVYSSRNARTVKIISEVEQIYYVESDFPWPMTDRDLLTHNKIWQDSETFDFYSSSVHYVDEDVPAKKDMVRVPYLKSLWTLKPRTKGTFHLTYTLKSDPGGNIPAWAINMMLDVGPFKTLKNLQKEVEKPKYKNAHYHYIVEPFYTRRSGFD